MPLDWKSAYAAMHRDGEAAFPPAALYYVLEIVRKRSREQSGSASALTPKEIITTFRNTARADFGSLTREVLEDWRIRTPRELGEAVTLLGRYRCLTLDPSDTVEAFTEGGVANLPFEEGTET